MAKVTGPLMSMQASGAFAGTLVFANRIGKNVVRQLVTPSNPRAAGQTTARNAQRVAAACQSLMNRLTTHGGGRSVTDKAAMAAICPSGQRWNSFFVKNIIGAGALNYAEAQAAYAATSSGNKTTWDAAAAALTPAMSAVNQTVAITNAAATPISDGNAWYIYQYGLYKAGITTAPVAGTPPTYA